MVMYVGTQKLDQVHLTVYQENKITSDGKITQEINQHVTLVKTAFNKKKKKERCTVHIE